jgi:hypothetical protein
MKKSELVIGESYWCQEGQREFDHRRVVVLDINPKPPERRLGAWHQSGFDKSSVMVDFYPSKDGDGESNRRNIRCSTIKGLWAPMKEDYETRKAAKDQRRRERAAAEVLAKEHYIAVYAPKYKALEELVKKETGKRFPSTFGGAEWQPLSGMPEEIVDLLTEALVERDERRRSTIDYALRSETFVDRVREAGGEQS